MSKIYDALNKAKGEPEGEPLSAEEIQLRGGVKGRLGERLREVWTQYEALHSSLGKALQGVAGKTIVFASSVEGEGTSTVVAEYGASLGSTKDKGTLLVDANFRSPKLHDIFEVPNELGLADFLTGSRDLGACVSQVGEENLYILPTGVTTISPGALVTITRFQRLLEQAKEKYALVLIDAPPVISYSETALIASITDGLALIVESERTKREIVKRSKTILEEARGTILGVVLNRRRYVIPEFLYRYL